MKRQVLVVSHADADGHVIAEQVRRNLESVKSFDVTTVVDPRRTAGHKAWTHLDLLTEIETSDIVFFVDLMFAPASFGAEADALVHFAKRHPQKRFFVLDHHPLPLRRLGAAPNLRAIYRQDVLDCTFGTSSPMMIIAALCESQPTRAKELKKPIDDDIAKGMKRAAAIGGPLSGPKLSALLRFGCWNELASLGREDASEHRLPRGRRPAGDQPSKKLSQLNKAATELLTSATTSRHHARGTAMSYDFETATDRKPPKVADYVPQKHDLETVVILLQLAAIELTPTAGTEFTLEELLDTARSLSGDDVVIDETDVKIVLGKAGFLKKVGANFRLK